MDAWLVSLVVDVVRLLLSPGQVLGGLVPGRLLVVAAVLASLWPGLVEAAVVAVMPVRQVLGHLITVYSAVVTTMHWMSSMYDEVEGKRL